MIAAMVEKALAQYRSFEECLLEELRWSDAGRVLELEFGYIWDDDADGGVLPRPTPVVVRLGDALVVRIESPLTPSILEQPDRLDWGVKEIAQFRLARQPEFLARPEGMDDALHLVAAWEVQGRIDILCRDLSIENLADA